MTTDKTPVYQKAAYLFIAVYGIIYMIYAAQSILVPLVFATLLAILLNPLVTFLNGKGIHNLIAISIAVTVVFIVLAGLFSNLF